VKHRYQNKNNLQKTGFLVQKYISKKALSIAALASLFACSAYAMHDSGQAAQDEIVAYETTQDDLDQALFNALTTKHARSVTSLLARGANPVTAMANSFDAASIDPDFFSSLIVSTAHMNNPTITQALLDARADINVTKDGKAALAAAISSSALGTVKFLLDNNLFTLSDEENQALLSFARTRLRDIESHNEQEFGDPNQYYKLLATAKEIIALFDISDDSNTAVEAPESAISYFGA
jgi:hypothetical protein